MKLHFEHRYQTENSSCGPVSLGIVFEYLGIPFTHDELMMLCDTQPEQGTENDKMIETAIKKGANTHVKENAKLTDLEQALSHNEPSIINYFNPLSQCGHYAVVQELTNTHIVFMWPKKWRQLFSGAWWFCLIMA